MNSRNLRAFQVLRFLILALAVLGGFAFTPSSSAAEGGRKLLKLEISRDRSTAEVVVPAGFSRVTLMRFDRGRGWQKAVSREAKPGVVRFQLPKSRKDTRWRAIGIFAAERTQRKFPASFYAGKKNFEAVPAPGGTGIFTSMGRTVVDNAAVEVTGGVEPVEADIWKVDGTTVFFFNQLRGLQVLDVSKASDPRLLASLRLPALGEDLYLLPGSSAARDLVLLTRHDEMDGDSLTRIRIVRYEAGTLRVTHRQDVRGYLADSRMVGDRLILATTDWGGGITVTGDDVVANGGGESISRSRLTQWVIRPGEPPKAGESFPLPGNNPLIAAGVDWLAAAVTPENDWNSSLVTVFALGKTGLVRMHGQPVRTAGRVSDKFKMQWRDHVLTTISEKNDHPWRWQPVTVLQNFRVWGPDVIVPAVITDPRLGSIELAKGESLFATRFAGNKAYIVTFLQTDPLWVVDLSNPAKPVVAGHIEVPGWSTYLEPVGDLLFSVGWESGTVAASLFDVSDPATPSLLRRVNLGPPGSYSEAAWDEQALKLLKDAGLVLIPLVSSDAKSGEPQASVQLLDLDLANKDLRPRGAIPHAFDARRSEIIGGAVVSISQRVLVTADVSDRDHPDVLAEVSLAWPVDRMLDAGSHLIQIENGGGYMQSRATARVSLPGDTEAVLSETDLGDGVIRDADLRAGRLYVLRETGSNPIGIYRRLAEVSQDPAEAPTLRFHLDVYDVSALPSIVRAGTRSVAVQTGFSVGGAGLLWPHPNRPSVLLQPVSSFWYGWDLPIIRVPGGGVPDVSVLTEMPVTAEPASKMAVDLMPWWRQRLAPRVIAFDVSDPANPGVSAPVTIGTTETNLNGVAAAADGIIAAGASDGMHFLTGLRLPPGKSFASLHVIEVPVTGDPLVRPGIDLPGAVFALTDLDRDGFLAWTREWTENSVSRFAALACDGHDAFEVASLELPGAGSATADGRRLFVSTKKLVQRFRLRDLASFEELAGIETRFQAHQLRVEKGVLIGAGWRSLFAAGVTETTAPHWAFPVWSLDAQAIEIAADGDLLVPFGDYGASRLDR